MSADPGNTDPGGSGGVASGAAETGGTGVGGGAGGAGGASQLTYEAASARVEEIIRRLDSGEASLSETLALVTEGKQLIEHCAAELNAVGGALEELRLDELVARLEQQEPAEP